MTSAVSIDMVSDVVCPWCFIGKRRLEKAIALRPDIRVEVRFRPYFLNPWVPREGISRHEYLNGYVRLCLQPETLDKESQLLDEQVFDVEQLELTRNQDGTLYNPRPVQPMPLR